MPHSNFAVFGGWYFFQYCSQKAENCTNCPTLTALSTFAFNSYTAISRKVVGKKCTRQSRKVLWDMINTLFLTLCSCRTYFCCFALALGNIVHGLSRHSFKISMKNSYLKTTQHTFRDCRVHFFRQPFSK